MAVSWIRKQIDRERKRDREREREREREIKNNEMTLFYTPAASQIVDHNFCSISEQIKSLHVGFFCE